MLSSTLSQQHKIVTNITVSGSKSFLGNGSYNICVLFQNHFFLYSGLKNAMWGLFLNGIGSNSRHTSATSAVFTSEMSEEKVLNLAINKCLEIDHLDGVSKYYDWLLIYLWFYDLIPRMRKRRPIVKIVSNIFFEKSSRPFFGSNTIFKFFQCADCQSVIG